MAVESLGPWSGGLNLSSNRDLSIYLKNNELGEATNVIFTNEGFVEPRPGCKVVQDMKLARIDSIYGHITEGDGEFSILGRVVNDDGVWLLVQVTYGTNQGVLYKVRSAAHDSLHNYSFFYSQKLFEFSGHKLTHAIVHSGFVGEINVTPPPDSTSPPYNYKADTGVIIFTDTDATTYLLPFELPSYTSPAVPPMVDVKFKVPASHIGMVVKDRLFLFDKVKSKMWWGAPLYLLDFRTDADVVAVAPFGKDTAGEENIEPTHPRDLIRNVAFYNNNFYIFKAFKTYMFTYQDNPTTDGYMRKISNETGAFDCCVFRDNIIVINNRGVFRIDGTEFVDLQQKMNFGFEIPLDQSNVNEGDIFITSWNQNILFGLRDRTVSPNKYSYYNLNSLTGAWSKWEYNYAPNIAAPGSEGTFTQQIDALESEVVFVSFNRKYLSHMHWKPLGSTRGWEYHLDSDTSITYGDNYDKLYFPNIAVKTSSSFGQSTHNYKKLNKYFIRFYLSEPPADETEDPVWTLSINYDDYKFDSTKNPIFGLYPVNDQPYPDPLVTPPVFVPPIHTAVYKRTYQIVLPQQRAREFVFELKRRFTVMPVVVDTKLINDDEDRKIKSGYYFALSGLWVHYQDKAQI
jgi:hypothetical protein